MLLTGSTLSGIDRHDNLTLGSYFYTKQRGGSKIRFVRRFAVGGGGARRYIEHSTSLSYSTGSQSLSLSLSQ